MLITRRHTPSLTVRRSDFRKSAVQKLVADGGWTFPVYFDTEGSATTAYSVRSMPTTIFVSADGELVGKRVGALSAEQLQAQIDALLAKE